MAEIIDIRNDQDLPGCVCAPILLMEMARACSVDIRQPIQTLLEILAELAQHAVNKDDPALNVIALRMGLFKIPPDKLKSSLEREMARVKKCHEDDDLMERMDKKSKEKPDGQADTVA